MRHGNVVDPFTGRTPSRQVPSSIPVAGNIFWRDWFFHCLCVSCLSCIGEWNYGYANLPKVQYLGETPGLCRANVPMCSECDLGESPVP